MRQGKYPRVALFELAAAEHGESSQTSTNSERGAIMHWITGALAVVVVAELALIVFLLVVVSWFGRR